MEVIDEDEIDLGKISIGCTVSVLDLEFDEELDLVIVGSSEANSLEGKISNESPLGLALLGRTVNEEVVVETPAGNARYRILMIQKTNG